MERMKNIYRKIRALTVNDESRLTLGLLIVAWNDTRVGKKFGPGLYRHRRAVEQILGIDLKFGTSPYGECNEGLSCRNVLKAWKAALKTPRLNSYYGKKNKIPQTWGKKWFEFLVVCPNGRHRDQMKEWLLTKYSR